MPSLAEVYSQLSDKTEDTTQSNSLADAYAKQTDSYTKQSSAAYAMSGVKEPEETLEDKVAFAAQMGFADTYRGVKQIFGINEEEMKRDQKRLERYLADEKDGGKIMAAYTAGLIGDPVGWVIPGMKAKNVAQAVRAGALFGAISGATGYVPENMTRGEATALGTLGGGILSPAMFKFNNTIAPALKEAYGTNVVPTLDKYANMATEKLESKLGKKIQDTKLGSLGRYFIDDFGLPPAYVEARKNKRINQEEYSSRFVKVLEKYENLTPEQDKLLYKLLTGEESKMAGDLSQLTKESRKVVDDMGKEMVDLGLLDKAVYKENKGKYLYRSYKKTAVPDAAKMNREAGAIRILGGEFMRRGKTKTIPVHELKDHLSRGYKQVSGKGKDGMVSVNRDWTEAERKEMGEIVSASYGFAKTGQLMTNDLATYKFYDTIAKDKSIVWEPINKRELSIGIPQGYVKVPEDKLGNTSVKRYGNLAGKYVPESIMKDLKSQDLFKKVWRGTWIGDTNHKLNKWWKRTKTTLNPTVHINNMMANTKHYDMADGNWQFARDSMKEILKKEGKDYQLAKDLGVFNADLNKNELTNGVNKYLRKYLSQGVDNADSTTFMDKIVERAKYYGTFLQDTPLDRIYSQEDNVFRLGLFKTRLAAGDTAEEAAKYARKWMIDYEVHAPAIKALRELPLPFITYSYRAAPLLAETFVKKPWKIAKWGTILYGANQIGIDISGEETERDRRLLEATTQNNKLYGMGFAPLQIKLPRSDKKQYLDVNRWYPLSDVMETDTQGFSIPGLPAPLQPSGGAFGGVAKVVTGFDTFSGKFAPGVGSGVFSEEVKGRTDLFFKEFFPFVNQYNKIDASLAEGSHPTKDDYSFGEAMLNSVGVKVKTMDERKLVNRAAYKYKSRIQSLKQEARQIATDFYGGRVSREDFVKRIEELKTLINEIAREGNDTIKY